MTSSTDRLRFGVLVTPIYGAETPPGRQLQEHRELVQSAARLGFDLIVAGQHFLGTERATSGRSRMLRRRYCQYSGRIRRSGSAGSRHPPSGVPRGSVMRGMRRPSRPIPGWPSYARCS